MYKIGLIFSFVVSASAIGADHPYSIKFENEQIDQQVPFDCVHGAVESAVGTKIPEARPFVSVCDKGLKGHLLVYSVGKQQVQVKSCYEGEQLKLLSQSANGTGHIKATENSNLQAKMKAVGDSIEQKCNATGFVAATKKSCTGLTCITQ
jgi:hypothetical protein